MSEREEWQALVDADLDLLPKEALIASVKQLAGRLLELTPSQARFWHAYQAEIPELLEDSLGPVMAFTIIGDTPHKEAPQTNLGVVLNHELVFWHVHTWDHEPTEAEKEQVQLAQFQLAKEKEEQ